MSCLPYIIWICLHIVVSNTYCVVFFFVFFPSCVPYICCQFLWIVHFWLPLQCSLTYFISFQIFIWQSIKTNLFVPVTNQNMNFYHHMSRSCCVLWFVVSSSYSLVSLDCPFLIAPSVFSNIFHFISNILLINSISGLTYINPLQ
jgi:hypothetical protein